MAAVSPRLVGLGHPASSLDTGGPDRRAGMNYGGSHRPEQEVGTAGDELPGTIDRDEDED